MIGENCLWEYNIFNEDKNIFLKKRTNSTFINQTNDDNKENINDNMSFEDILKMSIQEKKNNDKIERDLKKANKINLMKIQRNKMILWNNNNNIKKFN